MYLLSNAHLLAFKTLHVYTRCPRARDIVTRVITCRLLTVLDTTCSQASLLPTLRCSIATIYHSDKMVNSCPIRKIVNAVSTLAGPRHTAVHMPCRLSSQSIVSDTQSKLILPLAGAVTARGIAWSSSGIGRCSRDELIGS